MHVSSARSWGRAWLPVVLLVLSGCSSLSKPTQRAPVEDRGSSVAQPASPAPAAIPPAIEPATTKPVDANAGRPGSYTVKPGDTLIRVGLDTGQNWRDIVRWNAIDNPNVIEVGQVLRVLPPVPGSAPVVASETGVVTRPVTSAPAATGTPLPPAAAASAAKPGTTVAVAPPVAPVAPAPAAPAASGEDELAFIWPVSGTMINGFDEAKNKGVDLAGKVGDAVLAAADGKVVYAGAGLRGYGNLIILKHNNTFLTAYAHNQTLLVKEDQTVRKGQKVAEMGNSDADRVKLHFEIRRQGKPVDPTRYLPARPTP